MLRGFHAMIRKMSRVDTAQKNFSTLPGWKKTASVSRGRSGGQECL